MIRSDGREEGDIEGNEVGIEIGGARAPVEKRLAEEGPYMQGQEIPYEIIIRNDGIIDLETLPISDFYDPAILRFLRAEPPPSSVDEAD
ncbi:MAG: hypothetical protein HC893_11460, partial [Chloroflexaceae bacterium]|nr:hypothetical protein [Chloroflexaceae bacterium]